MGWNWWYSLRIHWILCWKYWFTLKPFAILATTINVAFTQKNETYKFNARILFKMWLVSIFVLFSQLLVSDKTCFWYRFHLSIWVISCFFPYLFNFFSENSLCIQSFIKHELKYFVMTRLIYIYIKMSFKFVEKAHDLLMNC